MSENELQDTQPKPVSTEAEETQPNTFKGSPSPVARKKFPAWLAVLAFIVLLAVGILGGYGSGMGRRYSAQNTQVTGQLQEQYQLGMDALDAGKYEVARQHFEYIIQHNPDYPGVQKAYTDLLLRMMITPTLTPTLTPTITPTPDLRSVDEIYNNVVALLSAPADDLCARDWNDILARLDSLRKADINYRSAEVDGMYYISLRSRGVCKIYPQTYEPNAYCEDLNINLNGGIYDLTLAERFGPLDSNADTLRTWARMYIAGASFWDQDWDQVKSYFTQVMSALPNLSDSSCVSATERWRQASINYAQLLMAKGDFCGAAGQFEDAFTIDSSKNDPFISIAAEAQSNCSGHKDQKTPQKTKVPSNPATEVPTEVPTEAATEVPTQVPTP
jgi:tetratricopeptide (TPR) repeat protein